MNEKQNNILETYMKIYNFAYEISQSKNQTDFLYKLEALNAYIRYMNSLESRGAGLYEISLGLTDIEFEEVMKEIKSFVDG